MPWVNGGGLRWEFCRDGASEAVVELVGKVLEELGRAGHGCEGCEVDAVGELFVLALGNQLERQAEESVDGGTGQGFGGCENGGEVEFGELKDALGIELIEEGEKDVDEAERVFELAGAEEVTGKVAEFVECGGLHEGGDKLRAFLAEGRDDQAVALEAVVPKFRLVMGKQTVEEDVVEDCCDSIFVHDGNAQVVENFVSR